MILNDFPELTRKSSFSDLPFPLTRVDVGKRSSRDLQPLLPKVDVAHLPFCCQSLDSDSILSHAMYRHPFSLHRLAWAIQNGANPKTVGSFLDSVELSSSKTELQKPLPAAPGGPFIPILYFTVERNSPEIVRLLCNAGAEPSQRLRPLGIPIGQVPLLAFAVMRFEYDLTDTTDTVIILLAMGAKATDIPEDMWVDYVKAPTMDSPKNSAQVSKDDMWCTPEFREAICRNFNLMQRYALWRAHSLERQTTRMKEIGQAHCMGPLFETFYHIIGQRTAIQQVIDRIRDHALFQEKFPLVLLFTGPSGHGKTELAKRMGDLLSLDMQTIDCTQINHSTDLFGQSAGYAGWDKGAPLNNFLSKNAGKRCVVFLDEMEKTTQEVRNALLKVFDEGFYNDIRSHGSIDCSKVIWVLASNLGCHIIQAFWDNVPKDQLEDLHKCKGFSEFEKKLKQNITMWFQAPFVGRIHAIVPFMPFNDGERAVAGYKFMRNLHNTVREPVDTNRKFFPGHIFVDYRDDGSIASHIANESYSTETGARPLERAVNNQIRGRLSRAFLGGEEMVTDEANEQPLENYEVRLVSTEGDMEEIVVEQKGTREILSTAKA